MSDKTEKSSYEEFNFSKKNLDKIEPLDFNLENNQNDSNKIKTDYDAEYILKNSNKKVWRILRLTLQIIVLLTFIGLFAFIIAVIIVHPVCEKEPSDVKWWSQSLIYKIELEKFKELGKFDSIFKLIKNNTKYFKLNNVDAIWLSEIIDLDYGFTSTYSSYGTNQELNELIKSFHEEDIKVIIDFIPNHSTDKTEWFLKSKQGDQTYKDYYIWSDTSNNWKNVEGVSAWTKSDNGKFYYHKYKNSQPDLNYRNPKVIEELHKSLKFWLDSGVDGFNLVGFSYLIEDYLLRDEIIINEYTQHQRETFYLIAELKDFINQYKANTSREIALINTLAEESQTNDVTENIIKKYYGSKNLGGFDLLIFDQLFKPENSIQNLNALIYIRKIDDLLNKFNTYDKTPIWMLDKSNMQLNQNQSFSNLLQASFAFLPGSAIIQLQTEDYKLLLSQNNTINDNLNKNIGLIRHGSKSLKFSKIKYNVDNFNECDYVEFIRYFDGENSFSFHLDIDNRCKNELIKFKSKLIKGETVNLKYFENEFSNDKNFIKKLKNIEKINFNSNGETSKFEIPKYSFLILTWPYQPPDLKDIL